MNEVRLKNLLYWSYAVVATLVFSAIFISVAAYQYDIDSSSIRNVTLYRELAGLVGGVLVASLVTSINLRKILLAGFLSLAVASLFAFAVPGSWTFWSLYIVVGFIFGIFRLCFAYELSLQNSREEGLLSDICHLETAYMSGVMLTVLLSGAMIYAQQLELHQLYLVSGIACLALGALVFFMKDRYEFGKPSPISGNQFKAVVMSLPNILSTLSRTLIALMAFCLGLIIIVNTFIFAWMSYYNASFLQLSDTLVWQYTILLIASIISSRLITAALVHYFPLQAILITKLLISIIIIMIFAVSMFDFQPTSTIDSMPDLPTPMLLILVLSFTTGSIGPVLVGIATFHSPIERRGHILGLITVVTVIGAIAGRLLFNQMNKLFDPVVLLGSMVIPLAITVVLSTLFIYDLRRSTSSAA
ncbi:MFS transporter [Rhodoflexus sp.]